MKKLRDFSLLCVLFTLVGCSHDCEYMSDETFCSAVEEEDWETVENAFLDYIDEVQQNSECHVDVDNNAWENYPEISSSLAWLEEKDCVAEIHWCGGFLPAIP